MKNVAVDSYCGLNVSVVVMFSIAPLTVVAYISVSVNWVMGPVGMMVLGGGQVDGVMEIVRVVVTGVQPVPVELVEVRPLGGAEGVDGVMGGGTIVFVVGGGGGGVDV